MRLCIGGVGTSTLTQDDAIRDIEALDELLSRPTVGAIEAMARLKGDLLILGVGGKMGPTLARMARRASNAAGIARRIVGVSRFSQPGLAAQLNDWGIETFASDLLNQNELAGLPDFPNIIYMAGMKFGSSGNPSLTWAMNVELPSLVCHRFSGANIVAFSTGNVYPLISVTSGGSVESDPPNPVGEYAMSCLGRERMFEHHSLTSGIRVSILRLSYAVEMRYGVLVDIAGRVWRGEAVDLTMGNLVAIWQGDANAFALQSFDVTSSPARILNITGPEILSVRQLAHRFGELLDRKVTFKGSEGGAALLSNTQRSQEFFGYPSVTLARVIAWTAEWVRQDGATLNKPTHFEATDGRF